MQFMRDQPKPRGKNEGELLYELLRVSKSLCAGAQGVGWGGGDTVCPEGLFLSSCLDLSQAPLVNSLSNDPKVFTELHYMLGAWR